MEEKLTPEQAEVIANEEQTLNVVLEQLHSQLKYRRERLSTESERARSLTSELVNAPTAEDKQLVASDEAVAHGMRDLQRKELSHLPKLIKNPYFARLVVEEELESGMKEFEYRIGLIENPDCRILDWRKAPIAKLYYDYKEGDSYDETILGRERVGQVKVRNLVTIRESALKEITCRYGTLVKHADGWQQTGQRVTGSSGSTTLQQIASMLTPEQFKLLESNAERALVLHGIAGSGKTTLALHRLSWLLGQPERAISEDRCIMLVGSIPMKTYLGEIAESLGLGTVKIQTKSEWLETIVARMEPQRSDPQGRLLRPASSCSSTLRRVKGSAAVLATLESLEIPVTSPYELLLKVFERPSIILERDESKLIASEDLREIYKRLQQAFTSNLVDEGDEALLVIAARKMGRSLEILPGTFGLYDHVLVDEAQDYSVVELAACVASVAAVSGLTIVGDTAQSLATGSGFASWQSLIRLWKNREDLSQFITLTLSYRSTIEIRRFAAAIRNEAPGSDQGRHGRIPIWFQCKNESHALDVARNWVKKSLELYPNGLTAVLCKSAREAKEVVSQLTPTFGGMVRYAEGRDFSFHAGVVVATVEAVRGMEFSNLLIWNVSDQNFPKEELSRNLLYVAVTRSRENVAIVTFSTPSTMLPRQSSLVRIIKYDDDE